MKAMVLISVALLTGASSVASQEIPQRLECTVLEAKRVGADGQMQDVIYPVGDDRLAFVVDRRDGRMRGLPRNYNDNGTPEVLEPGSPSMDFKVVTVYRPFAAVQVLQIRVWAADMPFMFADGLDVFSGTCRAFAPGDSEDQEVSF